MFHELALFFCPAFRAKKLMRFISLSMGLLRSTCEVFKEDKECFRISAFVFRKKIASVASSIAICLIFYSVSVPATPVKEPVRQNLAGLSSDDQKKLQDYLVAQDVIKLILPKLDEDRQRLMLEVKLQGERVRGLEREIAELKKPDENGIATILLSAVSVIICSGLMKPDTHLGENARQIEVSDDQTTPLLYS